MPLPHQGLYLGTVETGVRCPKPEGYSLLHISVCCKSLASQMLLKGYTMAEITACQIRPVRTVVHKHCNQSGRRHAAVVFPFIWTPKETSAWQAICNRCCPEASCHHLAKHPWHECLYCQDTSLGDMVEQMLECMVTTCWSHVYHMLPCQIPHQIQNSVHHQGLLTSFFVSLHPYISHIPHPVHVNKLQIFTSLQTRSFSSVQWEKTLTMFRLLIQYSHGKWKNLRINNEVEFFTIVTIKLQDSPTYWHHKHKVTKRVLNWPTKFLIYKKIYIKSLERHCFKLQQYC